MAKRKVFTPNQIKEAWKDYKSRRVMKVLKQGKWQYHELNGKGLPHVEGVKASVVTMSDVLEFPTFLEKEYA